MANLNPNALWFTEAGAAAMLPRPFKCVAPVWDGGMLIQDANGQWWLREAGRWLAEDITREIKEAYAWSLFGMTYPDPTGDEPMPEPIRCASGEIEC